MYIIVGMKEQHKCAVLHGKYMQVLKFSAGVVFIMQSEPPHILYCVNLPPSWSLPFNNNINNFKVT